MTQQLLIFTALTEDVGLTTIYNFMSRGNLTPSSGLHRYCMHVVQLHTHRQNTPTQKINTSTSVFKQLSLRGCIT